MRFNILDRYARTQNKIGLTVFFTPLDDHSQRYGHIFQCVVRSRIHIECKHIWILETITFQRPFEYNRSSVMVDAQQFGDKVTALFRVQWIPSGRPVVKRCATVEQNQPRWVSVGYHQQVSELRPDQQQQQQAHRDMVVLHNYHRSVRQVRQYSITEFGRLASIVKW